MIRTSTAVSGSMPGIALTLVSALLAGNASAQTWPAKSISFLVPYGAGSPTELQARQLAEQLVPALNVPVLVESRPGAGGVVGVNAVVRSTPDGYTLLYTGANIATFRVLVKDLPFDPLKDLMPVSLVCDQVSYYLTNNQTPFNTIDELIAYAKANPGKLNYGSAGRNTVMMRMEALTFATGTRITEIPYAGQAQYVTAALRNEVQLIVGALGGIMKGQVDSGALRPLLVIGEKRTAAFPNVPSTVEKGWAIADGGWSGVFAPAGTPAPIIQRLVAEIARYTSLPGAQKRAQDLGVTLVSMTPEQFRKKIETEAKIWADVAATINMKPE